MRLIDAEALFKIVEMDAPVVNYGGNLVKAWVMAALRSENMCPTIEAVPVKHGRWVPMYELTSEGILLDEPMGYMCDQCKAKRRKRLNYCSDCGAKMDGGEA